LSIYSFINLPSNFFQNTEEIEKLKFSLYHSTIDNMKPFNDLEKLKSLDINDCSEIDGNMICDLVNLETLEMEDCLNISQESLMNLGILKHLNISGCNQMTDQIFNYRFATNLKSIELRNIGNRITDNGVVKLQNLESIDASSIRVNDNLTVDVLHKLSKLKSIDMSCSDMLTNETLGKVPIVNQMILLICGVNANYLAQKNLIHLKDIPHLTICSCYYKFLTKEILDCWESHGKMLTITIVTDEFENDIVFTDFKELQKHIQEILEYEEFDRLVSARFLRKQNDRIRKQENAKQRRLALERKLREAKKLVRPKKNRDKSSRIKHQKREDNDDDSVDFNLIFDL